MYRYGLGAGGLRPYFSLRILIVARNFKSFVYISCPFSFVIFVLEQITKTAQVIYLDVFLYKLE